MQRSLSDSRLTVLSMALSVAGIAVSAYLSLVHYRDDLLVCAVGGCHTVQKSPYAELYGVPVALLGLGMFVAMATLGLLRRLRAEWAGDLNLITFGLALAGTVFTVYLTYLELFVIHAVCQWCVLTALLTWALLLVEGALVWRSLQPHDDLEFDDELESAR
jgi:uncharacterized membrane protein